MKGIEQHYKISKLNISLEIESFTTYSFDFGFKRLNDMIVIK